MSIFDSIWGWLLTPVGMFIAAIALWNWPWHA